MEVCEVADGLPAEDDVCALRGVDVVAFVVARAGVPIVMSPCLRGDGETCEQPSAGSAGRGGLTDAES